MALATAATCCAPVDSAKAQTADVQIRTEVVGGNTYATQSRAVRLRTTVVNQGPDAINSLDVQMRTNIARVNFVEPVAVPPCVASQGAVTSVSLSWAVGALAPGESRTCEVEFRARPTAQPLLFFVSIEAMTSGISDPLPGDNRAFIDLLSVSPIDIVQDMVLTIQSPAGLLPALPGSATADLVLTNRGPDDFPPNWVHLLRSEVYRTSGAGAESFIIGSTADPDCQLLADDVGNSRILQINYLNPIPPGGSQSCTVRVAARQGAVGARSLRWDVGRLAPGLLETNPADNTAFLVMQFSPAIIPVDARWALLLLIAGLGTLGGWHIHRART
jgi:hypothetical protein